MESCCLPKCTLFQVSLLSPVVSFPSGFKSARNRREGASPSLGLNRGKLSTVRYLLECSPAMPLGL